MFKEEVFSYIIPLYLRSIIYEIPEFFYVDEFFGKCSVPLDEYIEIAH